MRSRTLLSAIAQLWQTLSRRRRIQFYILLLVMVAASFAEIFSLGMIVPFLLVLTAPEHVQDHQIVRSLMKLLSVTQAKDLVPWLALAFCFATILAAAIRVFLLYVSTGFSFALGADLSLDIYRRTLYQPYRVHLGRNSSEVINGVIGKTNAMINNVIGQLLTIASSTLLLFGILAALLAISVPITLSAVVAFVAIYGSVLMWSRRRLVRDSEVVSRESTRVVRAIQEGLGGIRDVLVDGTQETFTGIYQISDRLTRAAQGRMALTAGSPRFIVEGLGMIFIAVLAAISSAQGQPQVIPTLGALALGAQRLLPVVQQAYAAIVTIRSSEASLWDVLELLEQPLPGLSSAPVERMPFEREIRLDGISFAYSAGGRRVLRRLNLSIPKGTRLGIFGPTGGGKSTLLDVLMALLEPSEGALRVDGVAVGDANRASWQSHVAHVPQSIFLADAPIAENIAFGRPVASIDMQRVREAAEMAQVADVIEALPGQYQAMVGERGVRLSGGQRQRLGIARALYKQADVIVLDEATSALDDQTEEELMEAIDTLNADLTIVMVAHRLSTLKNCNVVIEVADGEIRSVGSYQELIAERAALPSGIAR